MKKSRILIIPVLLFVFAIAGCDSDNKSNAQDLEMPGAQSCPCFSQDDIVNALNNSGVVSCFVSSLGFEFLDDANITLFGVKCDPDLSDCSCSNMSENQTVDELQADICLMFMTTSILNFEGVESVGCVFQVDE